MGEGLVGWVCVLQQVVCFPGTLLCPLCPRAGVAPTMPCICSMQHPGLDGRCTTPCPLACGAARSLGLRDNHPWSLATLVVYFHRSLLDAARQHAGPAKQQQKQQQSSSAGAGAQLPAIHPQLLEAVDGEWGTLSGAAAHRERESSALSGSGGSAAVQPQPHIIRRGLAELQVFQLPQQTNRLAVMFDPVATPQVRFGWELEGRRVMGVAGVGLWGPHLWVYTPASSNVVLHGMRPGRAVCCWKWHLPFMGAWHFQQQTKLRPTWQPNVVSPYCPTCPLQVPLVFGVEVFEGGHRTTPHIHLVAHEIFFIVSGESSSCLEQRFHYIRSGQVFFSCPV